MVDSGNTSPLVLICNVQGGSGSITSGNSADIGFAVTFPHTYKLAMAHQATLLHDTYGANIADKSKIVAHKTNTVTSGGTFTLSYLAIGW